MSKLLTSHFEAQNSNWNLLTEVYSHFPEKLEMGGVQKSCLTKFQLFFHGSHLSSSSRKAFLQPTQKSSGYLERYFSPLLQFICSRSIDFFKMNTKITFYAPPPFKFHSNHQSIPQHLGQSFLLKCPRILCLIQCIACMKQLSVKKLFL